MQLEIKDRHDREAAAVVFRVLDAETIAVAAGMSAITDLETQAWFRRMADAIREELMVALARADALERKQAS